MNPWRVGGVAVLRVLLEGEAVTRKDVTERDRLCPYGVGGIFARRRQDAFQIVTGGVGHHATAAPACGCLPTVSAGRPPLRSAPCPGEALFWSAILVSNTLGTSMGDFLSDSSGLGYAGGALLVSGALAVLVALMKVPAVPNVLLFWIAFVLTRPLGATAGDFLTKPVAKGGLDLGTAGSSAVLLAVLLGLMAYAQVRERRTVASADVREPVAPAGRLSPVSPAAGRPRTAPRACARGRGTPRRRRSGPGVARAAARGPLRRVRRRGRRAGRAGRAAPANDARYAGTVVGDVDADAAGLPPRGHGDLGGGVADGVGEQRADDAFEEGGRDARPAGAAPSRRRRSSPAPVRRDVRRAGAVPGGPRPCRGRWSCACRGRRRAGCRRWCAWTGRRRRSPRGWPGSRRPSGAGPPPVELGDDPG